MHFGPNIADLHFISSFGLGRRSLRATKAIAESASRPRLLVNFRRDFRLGCEEFVLARSFTPRGNRWGCDFHSLDYQETEAVGRIDSTNCKPVFSSNRQSEYYSTGDCASSFAVRGTEATTSPAAGSDGDNQVVKYCFSQNSNRNRCRFVVGRCAVGKKK